MASKMLGQCVCPECGFQHAHVKINIDKEGKHPYRHCADGCGAQYFPRNKHQGDLLLSKISAKQEPEPNTPPPAVGPAPVEVPAAPAEKPKKYKTVFGVRVPVEEGAE